MGSLDLQIEPLFLVLQILVFLTSFEQRVPRLKITFFSSLKTTDWQNEV